MFINLQCDNIRILLSMHRRIYGRKLRGFWLFTKACQQTMRRSTRSMRCSKRKVRLNQIDRFFLSYKIYPIPILASSIWLTYHYLISDIRQCKLFSWIVLYVCKPAKWRTVIRVEIMIPAWFHNSSANSVFFLQSRRVFRRRDITSQNEHFRCHCKPGYVLNQGSCLPARSCLDAPCWNGGTCSGNGFAYTCLCPGLFGGRHCEYDQDSGKHSGRCDDALCANGGSCIQGT